MLSLKLNRYAALSLNGMLNVKGVIFTNEQLEESVEKFSERHSTKDTNEYRQMAIDGKLFCAQFYAAFAESRYFEVHKKLSTRHIVTIGSPEEERLIREYCFPAPATTDDYIALFENFVNNHLFWTNPLFYFEFRTFYNKYLANPKEYSF